MLEDNTFEKPRCLADAFTYSFYFPGRSYKYNTTAGRRGLRLRKRMYLYYISCMSGGLGLDLRDSWTGGYLVLYMIKLSRCIHSVHSFGLIDYKYNIKKY